MRITVGVSLAIIAAVALPVAARGEPGSHAVRLADGDSFSIGNERYRLYGIDAPELHQECTDAAGHAFACGTRARSELRRIIGTHPVQCRTVSTDRYGRNIAVCHAGGRDLAEEMVRAGFATVIERRGFPNPYESAETEARADKRGLWAGTFDTPRDWRRANPRDDGTGQASATPRDWLLQRSAALWKALSEWVQTAFHR